MRVSLALRLGSLALLAFVFSVLLVAATEPSSRRATQLPPMPWSSIILMFDGYGYCSGFVVGQGLIATAGHCGHVTSATAKQAYIKYIDGTIVPFKVLTIREHDDCLSEEWTLVMADTGKRKPFKLADAPSNPGDEVWHVGHPEAVPQEVLVSGRIQYRLPTAYSVEGTAIPGESGSPLVNRDGDVIGIVNCGSRGRDITIANRVSSLRAFMATFGLH